MAWLLQREWVAPLMVLGLALLFIVLAVRFFGLTRPALCRLVRALVMMRLARPSRPTSIARWGSGCCSVARRPAPR